MDSIDTVRAAEDLIGHFKRDAAIVAADWADVHLSRGETEEYLRLMSIIRAIAELKKSTSLPGSRAYRRP